MKRIVVIADITWAIGRIHKDIEEELRNEYEFRYYNSANFILSDFLKTFRESDLCLSTLNLHNSLLDIIKTPQERTKLIFVCHGQSEIHKNIAWSKHVTYGSVSDILIPYFPVIPYIVPNGVNADLFLRKPRSGIISTLGWCGATRSPVKRYDWSLDIARKTRLPLSIAETLNLDDLKQWYHSIDILLVTSGPESSVETGPLPPFEAIASGTLVVGTSVGNFRNVPGPKFSTIAEAVAIVNELKSHPECVQQLADEQYSWVMANWTYKTLASSWKTMFDKVVTARI